LDDLGEEAVERRQIELLLRQIPKGNTGAALGSLVVVGTCYPQVGAALGAAWLACVTLIFVARALLLRDAPQILARQASALELGRKIAAIHGIMGIAVASASWWFYDALDARAKLLLTLVLLAWPAGGIAVLGMHYRSFRVYLLCYFVTLASAWWYHHPQEGLIVLGMAVIVIILGSLARDISRLIGEVWTLEQQKDNLLKSETELSRGLAVEKDRAQQANLAKSQFLAAASHDLRQPVQALSLLSGVLQSTSTEPRVTEIASQIARASGSLDHLFTAILDISRLEAQEVKPEVSFFPVHALVARVRSEYRAKAAVRGLDFEITAAELEIETDPVLFERLVRNLLENAIRYTREGSVTLSLIRSGQSFELEVRDTGIGIAIEDQHRIFNDYYQVGGNAGATEIGMGLGLAIVRRLCDLLGLAISVDSAPGRGSSFRLAGRANRVRGAVYLATPAALPEPPDLRGIRILVVDDDELVRDALERSLVDWGAKVEACASLGEVESIVGSDSVAPDIAIVDYRLAEGPLGLVVAARLGQRFPNLKRIMMTGELHLELNLPQQDMPILRKPVSHKDFAALMRQVTRVPDAPAPPNAFDESAFQRP